MRLLLDTHVFLWSKAADPRMSAAAWSLLHDPGNELMISTASAAEIAIKASIGKLTFAMPLVELWEGGIRNAGIIPIPLTGRHALRTAALPLHHRDPFDRLLIGVALEEDLTLLTDDAAIHRYEVKAIW